MSPLQLPPPITTSTSKNSLATRSDIGSAMHYTITEADSINDLDGGSGWLTSGDKSLAVSAFKLSHLFFSLLSLRSSICWRSYGDCAIP
nr:hypothetical protein [Tanacetum cinerariifolium]